MTAYRIVTLQCDAPQGADQCHMTYTPLVNTFPKAREVAAMIGWTTSIRDDQVWDWCPDHTEPAPITLVVRG